ncbi:MAG: hypothetical protein AB4042_13285, partial [Leptolyngbyaceae cyanobacterium]
PPPGGGNPHQNTQTKIVLAYTSAMPLTKKFYMGGMGMMSHSTKPNLSPQFSHSYRLKPEQNHGHPTRIADSHPARA